MARRTSVSTGTGLELSGFPGAPNIKDTMELVTDKLRQLAQTRIGDKPYFFPDGIQLIQLTLSLQGQAQFSLTVSGAAKSVAVEGAEEALSEDACEGTGASIAIAFVGSPWDPSAG